MRMNMTQTMSLWAQGEESHLERMAGWSGETCLHAHEYDTDYEPLWLRLALAMRQQLGSPCAACLPLRSTPTLEQHPCPCAACSPLRSMPALDQQAHEQQAWQMTAWSLPWSCVPGREHAPGQGKDHRGCPRGVQCCNGCAWTKLEILRVSGASTGRSYHQVAPFYQALPLLPKVKRYVQTLEYTCTKQLVPSFLATLDNSDQSSESHLPCACMHLPCACRVLACTCPALACNSPALACTGCVTLPLYMPDKLQHSRRRTPFTAPTTFPAEPSPCRHISLSELFFSVTSGCAALPSCQWMNEG